jgi:hypothetical protein
MRCTLDPNLLPKTEKELEIKIEDENTDYQCVFDLDISGWRTFKYDRIVEVL